jgi:cell division topological specificity factor
MSGFFDRMLGRSSGKGSGSTAKQRLQFILVHDRINLPPEQLQAMKAEILGVISKYVSVDIENVDIALQQRDRDSLIVAEIPFSQSVDKDEARRRLNQPSNNTPSPTDSEDDG